MRGGVNQGKREVAWAGGWRVVDREAAGEGWEESESWRPQPEDFGVWESTSAWVDSGNLGEGCLLLENLV